MKSRSILNVITGLLYQGATTVLGLLLPYLLITKLGSESNGLINSAGQIFVYLELLEAGVGAATLQALYRPVSKDGKEEISSILSATNIYYRKTGFVYAGAVFLIACIYPFLVDSQFSAGTIRAAILLQGAGRVISYFIYAKYALLLRAEGKNYVINNLRLAEALFRNGCKIIALSLGCGILQVQSIHFFSLFLQSLFILLYIRRKYAWLDLKAAPDFKAISKKNAALVQSIAWVIFNHTDIMLLTVFSRNLALVSVYTVYLLVFEAIQNVTDTLRNSFQYKIGLAFQRSRQFLTDYFVRYSILVTGASYTLFCITYLGAAPFIGLYTGKVSDISYRLPMMAEIFMIYKVLYCRRLVNRQIIEAGGFFAETRGIAVRESVINLLASVLLVSNFGIYGVLAGTIIALIYSSLAYSLFVARCILESGYRKALLWQTGNSVLMLAVIAWNRFRPLEAGSYRELILKTAGSGICIAAAYILLAAAQLKLAGMQITDRKERT